MTHSQNSFIIKQKYESKKKKKEKRKKRKIEDRNLKKLLKNNLPDNPS